MVLRSASWCRPAVCFGESIKTAKDTPTRRRWPLVSLLALKRTFLNIIAGGRRRIYRKKWDLSLNGKVNATTKCSIRPWMSFARKKSAPLFILRPTSVRMWHKAFLRWALSQGQSPHASGSSKNASNPIGIPLFRAPQAPGDKPNPSEEG